MIRVTHMKNLRIFALPTHAGTEGKRTRSTMPVRLPMTMIKDCVNLV